MQFKVFDLGLVDFKKAWDFQREIFLEVKNNNLPSGLILCRHYPVITLGRLASKKNILISEGDLKNKGIRLYEIERGGDVTYHGPGQLVIYPIFNLIYFKRDIHLFLRKLEEVVIQTLGSFGILSERKLNLTGVWVGNKKIASIGVAIKNWIAYHGLAINIKNEDLTNFSLIRPCGLNIEMTSLETVLNKDIKIDYLKDRLIHKFEEAVI